MPRRIRQVVANSGTTTRRIIEQCPKPYNPQTAISDIQTIFAELGLGRPEPSQIPAQYIPTFTAPILLSLEAEFHPDKLEKYGTVMDEIIAMYNLSVRINFTEGQCHIFLLDRLMDGSPRSAVNANSTLADCN